MKVIIFLLFLHQKVGEVGIVRATFLHFTQSVYFVPIGKGRFKKGNQSVQWQK